VPNAFEENGVEEILALMKKHQIEKLVNSDSRELEIKARQQIEKLSVSAEMKEMINQFLDKITNRMR
jgi:geranylgeranyl pyrophosphate synthase